MSERETSGTLQSQRTKGTKSAQKAKVRRSVKKVPGGNERKSSSLTERAVNIIRDQILDLSFEPGARIDDRTVMEQHQLSRTPVREAWNRLAAEGLVEIRPQLGAFVRPIDLKQINQFFEAYIVSERVNGFLCNCKQNSLADDLLRIFDEHKKVVEKASYLEMTLLNSQLHLRIGKATENEYLIDFSSRLQNQARRMSFFFYRQLIDQKDYLDQVKTRAESDHWRIIELILASDNAGLVDLLTDHASAFKQLVLHAISHTRALKFMAFPENSKAL